MRMRAKDMGSVGIIIMDMRMRIHDIIGRLEEGERTGADRPMRMRSREPQVKGRRKRLRPISPHSIPLYSLLYNAIIIIITQRFKNNMCIIHRRLRNAGRGTTSGGGYIVNDEEKDYG